MTYVYDVFVSYSRRDPVRTWVHSYFKNELKQWLAQELDHDPTVFVDQDSIKAGDAWPETLKDALRQSRLMVAVLSADYFRSAWCLSEWTTMLERRRITNARVMYPVRFGDGRYYPNEATEIQYLDLGEYAYNAPGFVASDLYLKFQGRMKDVVREVAVCVEMAPPWSPEFPLLVEPADKKAPSPKLPRFS